MKYEAFVDDITGRLAARLGTSYRVERTRMTRNNGVRRDALTIIKKKEQLSPVIYPEEWYGMLLAGRTSEDICKEITRSILCAGKAPRVDPGFLTDWNAARERVVCRLVGAERNRERLSEVVHRRILDMAIVYYYMLETEESMQAGVIIKNHILSGWGLTIEQLDQIARINTRRLYPPVFASLRKVMSDLLDTTADGFHGNDQAGPDLTQDLLREREDSPDPIYVLTNSSRMNGAYWICDEKVLEDIRIRIGDRYLILPSSIHECMVVPAGVKIEPADSARMVREINRDCVDPEEVLTDSVYRYESGRGLVMAV